MNKNALIILIIIVLLIAGGLYWKQTSSSTDETQQPVVTSGENPKPGDQVHGLPAEPAAEVARKDLAAKLAIDEKSIVIIKVTETTWNDGCLGLGGPAESCLMSLVPGFSVELLAQGKTYMYRTDKTGASVRAETK
jgi:hypothetical protein